MNKSYEKPSLQIICFQIATSVALLSGVNSDVNGIEDGGSVEK